LFALRDRDGDRKISQDELDHQVASNLSHADLDGDGSLSQAEFLSSHRVSVVFRTAMSPNVDQ